MTGGNEEKVRRSSTSVENNAEEVVDVIIIGGGICGLVSALCLNRCGVKVRIYEQAECVESIGFGLVLQPYSVKILHELGLEKEMDEIGVKPARFLFFNSHGQFVYEDKRGLEAGYKWPSYSLHRGHFHQLLLQHVQQKLGQSTVQFSQQFQNFTSESDRIQISLVHTKTGQVKNDIAKLLIGADGIHSTLRKIFYPDEGPPANRGLFIWRGITSVEELYLDGRTMLCVGHPQKRCFVIYPVNKKLVNWACVIQVSEEEKTDSSSKKSNRDRDANVEELLPLIADMKLDFLDLRQLVKAATVVHKFPLTDRDVLSQWTFDDVTLVGDAAHPMYPYGGNGASQAILDARELYTCFHKYDVGREALQAYEDKRRLPTNDFVARGRAFGLDKILQLVEDRSPNGFKELSDVISSSEIEAIVSGYKQLPGWNVEGLNKEPPSF